MKTAIYPGSFDPVTLGHFDIIKRSSEIFDQVIVGVLCNNAKSPLFSVEERVKMLEEVTKDIPNVEVQSFDGLLVDFMRQNHAKVIVRGLRAITDFEYELQLAQMNRVIAPEIDTLFLTTNLKYAYLSSSMAKEVAMYAGDISEFLDPVIAKQVRRKAMSRIEQIITEIEDYIDSCKFQPLSNTKILVNKEEIEELLVELRLRIPEEIKKYQKIISNQDAILQEARSQADAMVAEATAQTNELVNEHEIMQRAYAEANSIIEQANAQAQQIVDNAVTEANNIRQGSVQYTDDMLRSLQTIIKHSMEGAQSRFESYMSSMQSSYDVVSSNRNELAGSVVTEPEENTGAEAAAAATQAASGEAAE